MGAVVGGLAGAGHGSGRASNVVRRVTARLLGGDASRRGGLARCGIPIRHAGDLAPTREPHRAGCAARAATPPPRSSATIPERSFDLLVVATRGRTSLERLVLGSVAE